MVKRTGSGEDTVGHSDVKPGRGSAGPGDGPKPMDTGMGTQKEQEFDSLSFLPSLLTSGNSLPWDSPLFINLCIYFISLLASGLCLTPPPSISVHPVSFTLFRVCFLSQWVSAPSPIWGFARLPPSLPPSPASACLFGSPAHVSAPRRASRSSSSDTGSRSSEPLPPPPPHVELRRVGAVKAAGGASGSRAKRISQLFRGSGTGATGSGGAGGPGTPGAAQRWASEKKLPDLAPCVVPEPPLAARATTPPGVLKIFGAGLASGANYKSVLATARSTARELVAEALERYGLAGSPGSGPGESSCVDAFALCDALGRPAAGGMGNGEWRAEHLRVLADSERPLLVQELWRARPGWARRFELRDREEARRLEQEAFGSSDSEGETARSGGRNLLDGVGPMGG